VGCGVVCVFGGCGVGFVFAMVHLVGRAPVVAGGRPVVVTIRLSVAEKARLDALRGGLSPADFFRQLLAGRLTDDDGGA
jgi:hypothetical protein